MKPTFVSASVSASLLALAATLLGACGGSGPSSPSPPAPDAAGQVCTEEAKVCPDGSSVGRTGPNCEFAPCPGEGVGTAGSTPTDPGPVCTKEAKVCPDGSTVGRVGPSCEFAPCPSGGGAAPGGGATCKDECGNGTCEEIVCQAIGCPCSETNASCPRDCK